MLKHTYMKNPQKQKKCEDCPLVSMLETAMRIKQASVFKNKKEPFRLLRLERHHLN